MASSCVICCVGTGGGDVTMWLVAAAVVQKHLREMEVMQRAAVALEVILSVKIQCVIQKNLYVGRWFFCS